MKWILLFIAIALVWPLSVRLRLNPRERLWLFVVIGFLPFITDLEHLYMAIDSWKWPGYVSGAEVSYLDLIAIAIYLSLPRATHPLPFRFSMALYFGTTVLSAIETTIPDTALFYPWQLARMFLLYATVYRGICADPRVSPAVLKGMAAGIFLEAVLTILQRIGGMLQTHGTYVHQNTLGMISHFTIFPFFALLLGGRRGWLPPAVLTAGLVVQVMTTSRGTIALGAFGLVTVFLLSALRRWSSRKAQLLLAGVAAISVLGPIAASSIQERFGGQESIIFAEDDERIRLKEAAAAMLSDHPMGVGANNYVFAGNNKGYFDLAGVAWQMRGANVHNVYWLVAAETGYVGLIAFIIFLMRPLTVAFACGLRHLGDPRGDLQLGLGVALLLVYLGSSEEWIFVSYDVQYQFAIAVGLVAGLARELGYWRRP